MPLGRLTSRLRPGPPAPEFPRPPSRGHERLEMSWRQWTPCRNTDRVNGPDLDIRPIDVLDEGQATAAEEWLDVFTVVQRGLFGDKGSGWTLPEIRAVALSSTKERIARSAYEGGRHVGSVEIHLFLKDNPDLAILFLAVRPEARGRGVGSYVDVLPESWLDDRAVLQQRMSTDAPSDDLDQQEEEWDAERLREQHDRIRAAGRRVVETAARHVPTGRPVGFTQVAVPPAEPTLGYQQDTLVLAEHRGHALGLRLKAANALALMHALPEVASVRTWNAASEEPMPAVNRALGYAVDGCSRAWQKSLAR